MQAATCCWTGRWSRKYLLFCLSCCKSRRVNFCWPCWPYGSKKKWAVLCFRHPHYRCWVLTALDSASGVRAEVSGVSGVSRRTERRLNHELMINKLTLGGLSSLWVQISVGGCAEKCLLDFDDNTPRGNWNDQLPFSASCHLKPNIHATAGPQIRANDNVPD